MQILAAVYEVSTTNYTSYDTSNTDTFYIMNNGDDVIMISLINSATMYMEVIFLLMIILQSFADNISNNNSIYIGIFIGSLLTVLVAFIALLYLFRSVEIYSQKILDLFLDIPTNCLKTLNSSCEDFIESKYNDMEDETDFYADNNIEKKSMIEEASDSRDCKF